MRRFPGKSFIFLLGFMVLTFTSCVSLKPYERIYINDPDMQMEADAGQHFGNYIHSIRESGLPAGSQTSGGGCGCK